MFSKILVKSSVVFLAMLVSLPAIANRNTQYKVEKLLSSGDYVINGVAWRPKSVCPHIHKGDKVSFVHGNANGNCVLATISKNANDSREKTCELWCDDF